MAPNLKRAFRRPFRLFLLGSTALALSLAAAGGTANAAPTLPTCGEATVAVNDAKAEVRKAQGVFDDAESSSDSASSALAGLKLELSTLQALPGNQTPEQAVRLLQLPGLILTAAGVDDADNVSEASAKTALDNAKTALAKAIDAQKFACEDKAVVTTTVAPPPPVVTTLKAPIPTFVVDKIVVQNSQFRTIPNVARGVATG